MSEEAGGEERGLRPVTTRRALLHASVGGVVGAGVASITGATSDAQAEASVTVEDQNSDGSAVVLDAVSTSVEATVSVSYLRDDGVYEVVGTLSLDAGADLTDVTVSLREPLERTSQVSVVVEDTNSETLAVDSAIVAVGDDIDDVGVRFVDADPESGFEYPYFLYVPPGGLDGSARPLLVEPNNTNRATDDFAAHRDAAEGQVVGDRGRGRELSQRLGTPLLVPVFPRPRSDPVDLTHYVHQLDKDTLGIEDGPLERVDLQLLAMVEDARSRLASDSVPVADDGVVMNGFSASGNFVTRFAALHPDEVVSLTGGGVNGMSVLPLERANGRELPYHVGVADVEALTGEPFDPEAFADVNRFLYMGETDVSDTIQYRDAFSDTELERGLRETALAVFGRNMQRDRFAYTKRVYREVGANAVFRQYDGVPHRTTRAIVDDLVAFHERTLDGESVESIRSDLGGNVPSLGAHVEYDTVAVEPGDSATFDGSRSALEAEVTDYQWTVDGERAGSGPTLEYAFETPGGHAVRLVVETADGETSETVEQVVVAGDGFGVSEPAIEVSDQSFAGRTLTIDRVATDREATLRVRGEEGVVSTTLRLTANEMRTSVAVDLTERPAPDETVALSLYDAEGNGFVRETIAATDDPSVDAESVGPRLVEANPEAGFEYPYFLYAPRRYADEEPGPLVVEPTNSPRPSDDLGYHESVARGIVENDRRLAREIADSLAGPLVVPVFPRPRSDPVDSRRLTHVLDADTLGIEGGPLERIDLQLLAMTADARDRLGDRGYPVADGTVLNGFSGSANFVDRFAALHPEAVDSVTAGGVNGMPILPTESANGRELPYHVGVANVEELTGEPFDPEAFREVDRLLYMGEFDDSDTIPFPDTFSDTELEEGLRETALAVFGPHMTDDRFPYSRAVYDDRDVGAAFRTYRGAGHTPRPAERDVVRFHKASLDGADTEALRARFGGAPNERAHVRYAPSRPATGERVTFDATRSALSSVDATPERYEWTFSDGSTATGPTASRTFDSAGLNAVTLVVQYTDGPTRRAVEYVPVGTDTTTVVTDAPSEGDGLAARFDRPDAGTPGSVDFPEVVAVIRAYNGGDPEISFGDVVAVIRAYNGGDDWDAVG